MRVKVEYEGPHVRYILEASGTPQIALRTLAMQARMCLDHERKIDKRIKADEYRERNRAQS